MRREEINTLDNLRNLVARDLTDVDVDEIKAGIRDAEQVLDWVPGWTGRLVAEARRRGVSWSELERDTGAAKATLDRRTTSAERQHGPA